MGVAFATPWMLMGLSLLALPVIAHLTGYREVRTVDFPTLRFLRESQIKARKRTRLESLLLLLLRLLMVLCTVLVFARPSVTWTAAGLPGLEPSRPSVILLDVSASTTALVDGEAIFERQREAAIKVLEGLAEGTPAAVIAFDDRATVLGPGLTGSHAPLLALLRDLQPGAGATDLDQALRRGRDLVRDNGLARAALLVLSDGTGVSSPGAVGEGWPQGLSVHYYDLGSRLLRNGFVDSVKVHTAAQQGAGIRVEVSAIQVGQGSADARPLTLTLEDGLQVALDLRFEAGVGTDSFTLPMPPQGDQMALLSLPGDDLPIDDDFAFGLRGDTSLDVLLVSGDGGSQPRDDEVYYLEKALQPGAGSPSRVHPRVVSAEALRRIDGGRGDVIFLCNVADPRPLAEDLLAFVEAGGGLFISVGYRTDPDLYNETLSELLPSRFTERKSRGRGSFEVSPVGLALPPLERDEFRVFRSGGAGVFSQVRFGHVIGTEPALASGSKVVLRYTDGLPALLERTVGKGRVLLFTSTIDDDWTDLPLRSIFVPLVHQVTRSLSHSLAPDSGGIFEVGEAVPVTVPADPERAAWLRGPDGSETRLDPLAADDSQRLWLRSARSPGHYRVLWADPGADEPLLESAFSVRVPSRESRLTAIDPGALQRSVPGLVFHRDSDASVAESPGQVVRTSSLLPLLLLALLAALVGEVALSLRQG
jgi:hypothetical protein